MKKLFSVLVVSITLAISSSVFADQVKENNLTTPQNSPDASRIFQLRTYNLRTKEAAQNYLNVHWKRHLESLPKFGIKVHGVFLVQNDHANQIIALVSYPEGANVAEIEGKYMGSPEFRADMQGFDFKDMVSVSDTILKHFDGFPVP